MFPDCTILHEYFMILQKREIYKGYLSNSLYIAALLELKGTLRMRLQNFKCSRSNSLDLLKPHISLE